MSQCRLTAEISIEIVKLKNIDISALFDLFANIKVRKVKFQCHGYNNNFEKYNLKFFFFSFQGEGGGGLTFSSFPGPPKFKGSLFLVKFFL